MDARDRSLIGRGVLTTPPAVRLLAGCGCTSALRMRNLADDKEMDLGGSLVVGGADLASVSASSVPGITSCHGSHRRVVRPGCGRDGCCWQTQSLVQRQSC